MNELYIYVCKNNIVYKQRLLTLNDIFIHDIKDKLSRLKKYAPHKTLSGRRDK